MAPQDLFFIKSLFSQAKDIADFLNTQKQTQRGRQNEEIEKFIPNKITRQGHGQKSK